MKTTLFIITTLLFLSFFTPSVRAVANTADTYTSTGTITTQVDSAYPSSAAPSLTHTHPSPWAAPSLRWTWSARPPPRRSAMLSRPFARPWPQVRAASPIHICMYTASPIHICMHTSSHIHIHACMHAYLVTHTHTYTYLLIHKHIPPHPYTYLLTYTQTSSPIYYIPIFTPAHTFFPILHIVSFAHTPYYHFSPIHLPLHPHSEGRRALGRDVRMRSKDFNGRARK